MVLRGSRRAKSDSDQGLPDPGWRPYYVLFCDDARREESRKEILIGVYSDDIVVANHFPIQLLSFVVRIAVWVERQDFKTVKILIKNPDGTPMIDATQPVQPQMTEAYSIFGFAMANPTFVTAGTYEIHFGFDNVTQRVGTLRLQAPADSA